MDLFATCARGLEPILAQELAGIHSASIEPGRGGVAFQGTIETVYRANLQLRTAVRVLRPLATHPTQNPDQLYDFVRGIDWSHYMSPDHTLAVDANVRDSDLTHSQYAARRVKDAICDQFRDRTGRRPSVDVVNPAIGINLHVNRNLSTLSLDSSWDSLHKRGYRPEQVRAPLNEALAAGLLLAAGYDGTRPLYDPMCGSGTIAIEAAWIALNSPPGLTRKNFAFTGWPEFDRGAFARLRDELRAAVRTALPHPIGGSDIRADAVAHAAQNAKAAGIGHLVEFHKTPVHLARPPQSFADAPPGLILTNPPYGERLMPGDDAEIVKLYQSLGTMVKDSWPGWELAIFTAAGPAARQVRLSGRTSTPFYNGSLQCRLWRYPPKATPTATDDAAP